MARKRADSPGRERKGSLNRRILRRTILNILAGLAGLVGGVITIVGYVLYLSFLSSGGRALEY